MHHAWRHLISNVLRGTEGPCIEVEMEIEAV